MKMQPAKVRQRLYDHEARLLKHGSDKVFAAVHEFRDLVDEQILDGPAETRLALEAAHLEALKNRKNPGWTKFVTPALASGLEEIVQGL